MKICETFSGNSLKEDLSIDTTFDPCYFLWDSPFKASLIEQIKVGKNMLPYTIKKRIEV